MTHDSKIASKRLTIVTTASHSLKEHFASKGLNATSASPDQLVQELFDRFAQISPPEEPPTQLITLDSLRRGGRSFKPGNIFVNAKAIFGKAVEGTLIVRGALIPKTDYISLSLTFLMILKSILELTRLKIGELEAAVLWTMWLKRDDRNCVSSGSLLALVNSQLVTFGKSQISQTELVSVLTNLQQMGCISHLEPSDEWRCVERITNSYY
jgi:hypothetical protein